MPGISDNAEVLRSLGHMLDGQGATTFEIVNEIGFLSVRWSVPGPESKQQKRAYQEDHIAALRAQADEMRREVDSPVGSLVELLRTIGQELDANTVELSSIRRDATGFHVSGASGGRHYQRRFSTKELISIAAARRAGRGRASAIGRPTPANHLPDSFLGVTMGASVFAEDGELLGTVVDVTSRHFKVGSSGKDGDYWLPAESVASIGPAGQVLLKPVF